MKPSEFPDGISESLRPFPRNIPTEKDTAMPSIFDYPVRDSAFDPFAYGIAARAEEADISWQTREMLDEICASVANVVEDASVDFANLPELFAPESAGDSSWI
jgi:hypothetical protein